MKFRQRRIHIPPLARPTVRQTQHAIDTAQTVLDRVVGIINIDPSIDLISAYLDPAPGYFRIVYRIPDWAGALGYRAHIDGMDNSRGRRRLDVDDAARQIARRIMTSRIDTDRIVGDPGSRIDWWGAGYPTGIKPPATNDDLAWSQWRTRELIPVVDISPAHWLRRGPRDAIATNKFDATVRLTNPDGDETTGISELPETVLTALADTLAAHTSTPEFAWFCVWDGYSWLRAKRGSFAFYHLPGTPPPPPPPPALPQAFHLGPFAHIEDRTFVLFGGPVYAAPNMGRNVTPSWFWRQWADFIWPDDHSWLSFGDIDEDTIDIAGTHALIRDVTAIAGLQTEPWPYS